MTDHVTLMTKNIKEILQRLEILTHDTVEIHKDWVQVVMSHFRQHLEELGLESKYPFLMFYCNWNLHIELDRGIVQTMLKDISKVIVDETSGHPADRISEILGLSTMRLEIIEVLKSAGVKSGVFEIYGNWKAFTELMFPFLLEKPLKQKQKPSTHHWVKLLELYDNEGQVFWRIITEPGESIFRGPLVRTDSDAKIKRLLKVQVV